MRFCASPARTPGNVFALEIPAWLASVMPPPPPLYARFAPRTPEEHARNKRIADKGGMIVYVQVFPNSLCSTPPSFFFFFVFAERDDGDTIKVIGKGVGGEGRVMLGM